MITTDSLAERMWAVFRSESNELFPNNKVPSWDEMKTMNPSTALRAGIWLRVAEEAKKATEEDDL